MSLRFRTKLLLSHGLLAVATALAVALAIEMSLGTALSRSTDRRLQSQAEAVADWMERARHFDQLAGRLAEVVDAQVTIVDPTGKILGDSVVAPDKVALGIDVKELPEIAAARAGKIGKATRYSQDQKTRMRYLAVLGPKEQIIRLGVPEAEIAEAREALRPQLVIAAALSLGVAIFLAGAFARALSRRVALLRETAEQLGRGDYNLAPPSQEMDEFGVLSRTMALSADKLKKIDTMRREFLANVAHELRTPVTSIRGYAETLADPNLSDAQRKEFSGVVHRNAVRISRLVDDLLQLESVQHRPRSQRERVPVPLQPVAESVMANVRRIATENDAILSVDIPEGLTVMAHSDDLEQVLQNLVENAVKYGSRGVTVALVAERAGKEVKIRVEDTGPGIPPDALPHIFERFYRVDKGRAREQGGTGLGLAIVRELLDAMDGRVDVTSSASGTCFTVTLLAG